MKERNVMSEEWNKKFIRGIFINKKRILKCIDIILTKTGVVFDEVCMILTNNMFENWEENQCDKNEVILSMSFPGYSDEVSYITYEQLFDLLEYGLSVFGERFNNLDKKEISERLEKAKFNLMNHK